MPIHRWFARRLERIAETVRSASDETFDAAVAKINALAETASRWMSWAPERDESPMSMELYVSADAAGENTAVGVDIDGSLVDHGAISVGVGRCTAQSAAEAGEGNSMEVAEAEAGSVVDGADFVLAFDHLETGPNHAAATHAVVAIDFDFYEAPSPFGVDLDGHAFTDDVADLDEGNHASVSIDVDVSADDSLADVMAEALVIEDRFSGSSIDAMLAIG